MPWSVAGFHDTASALAKVPDAVFRMSFPSLDPTACSGRAGSASRSSRSTSPPSWRYTYIAESLATIPNPVAALKDYESKRLPMAAGIVHMNRKQGIDVILDIVEERAPNGFSNINDVIPSAELAAIVNRYKQVAGHQQKK